MNEILTEIKNIKETEKDLKKFGLTVGIFLLVLSIIFYLLGKGSYLIFGIIALVLIFSALIYPKLLKPFNKVWMSIAVILGWFMTRVILTILFYIVLTPIGFLSKLFRKNFLDLKIDKSVSSYWEVRKKKDFNKSDFENQF